MWRSDDDQRSRLAFGRDRFIAPLERLRQHNNGLSHGWELSNSLTAYSPLPFNITTGSATIQGTSARPVVNGAFIGRNAGERACDFEYGRSAERMFALWQKIRVQVIAEMFNALNHVNVATFFERRVWARGVSGWSCGYLPADYRCERSSGGKARAASQQPGQAGPISRLATDSKLSPGCGETACSVRTARQGRTDWGPVIGSTDWNGRWSTVGQFES